jgi:hypothetical protein
VSEAAPSPADALRPLLFGAAPMDKWPAAVQAHDAEPWVSFVRARQLAMQGRTDEAIAIWRTIADLDGIESRHTLQAWYFLRDAGVEPPEEAAATVFGAVAEVAVDDDHDVLVAYRDGSARYLNHGGRVAIVESLAASPIAEPLTAWLALASRLAALVGVWDEPQLPALPNGHTRVMMLTPGGARFGQGPDGQLRQDEGAAAFLAAATNLLVAVTSL